VKKFLVLSVCLLGLGVSSPADAMMKKPTNVCEFLQYMDQKMDRMESSLNQRLDQMDSRLNQMDRAISFATTKACATSDDVNQIKQAIGSFGSGDCPKK
jgi:peptidoglycan hydrolase CwlO-like protein